VRQFFHRETLTKIALLLISTSIAILISEIGLRVLFPPLNGYYLWKPYLRRTFNPSPGVMPGIEGTSIFISNSNGIRGDELSPDHTYRILTIGGSTTECLYLDQTETWPHLLQEKLNENSRNHLVWVGNAGRSGLSTRDHVVQMRYMLQELPQTDAVIILTGVNDLQLRLAQDVNYDPHFLDRPDAEKQLLSRVFYEVSDDTKPFYKETAIWRLGREVKRIVYQISLADKRQEQQDEAGKMCVTWREHRRNAPAIRDTLPDLSSALEEYSRNINALIDLAEDNSVRLIFLTQPVLWKPDLPQELNDLLWFGSVGSFRESGNEYYSVAALATGMSMYNETLLDTCQKRRVECFDLASLVPKDTTAFYDDAHLNEGGAEMVAEVLAQYMLQRDPFR
jgi:lysophospholipase L1-like esterase